MTSFEQSMQMADAIERALAPSQEQVEFWETLRANLDAWQAEDEALGLTDGEDD